MAHAAPARPQDAPLECSASREGGPLPGGGPVWAVAFDRERAFAPRSPAAATSAAAGAPPAVLAATQGGALAACTPGGEAGARLLLPPGFGAAGVTHLALEPSLGAELAAVTQAEELLLWDAAAAENDELA